MNCQGSHNVKAYVPIGNCSDNIAYNYIYLYSLHCCTYDHQVQLIRVVNIPVLHISLGLYDIKANKRKYLYFMQSFQCSCCIDSFQIVRQINVSIYKACIKQFLTYFLTILSQVSYSIVIVLDGINRMGFISREHQFDAHLRFLQNGSDLEICQGRLRSWQSFSVIGINLQRFTRSNFRLQKGQNLFAKNCTHTVM